MKSVKGEVRRKPTIGDVVVVKDEGLPRGKWKLARIIGLIKGEVDGIERAANLKFSSGRTAKRPLKFIFPLECDGYIEDENQRKELNISDARSEEKMQDFPSDDQGENKGDKKTVDRRMNIERQTRQSAISARERIRDQINNGFGSVNNYK